MKLEINHLAPYLPYGLKVFNTDDDKDIIYQLTELNVSTDLCKINMVDKNYVFAESIHSIKPLLLPMSSLYTEMEDGTVHIVELAKLAFPCIVWEHEYKSAVSSNINGIAKKKFRFINTERTVGFDCINDASQRDFIPNQFDLFTYLFSHHFDVWNLIPQNLAIDKTKIK